MGTGSLGTLFFRCVYWKPLPVQPFEKRQHRTRTHSSPRLPVYSDTARVQKAFRAGVDIRHGEGSNHEANSPELYCLTVLALSAIGRGCCVAHEETRMSGYHPQPPFHRGP